MISFHKIMKLQSFELGVSEVIPANVGIQKYEFSLRIFVDFMGKNVLQSFMVFLTIFTKLRSQEVLNN